MSTHIKFIENDIPVFPLFPFSEDGECGCGVKDCQAAGKHPRSSNWQHTPVFSEEKLDNLNSFGLFDSGYGVLLDGLLVIDVDERNGGADSYAKLLEDVPEVAECSFIVKTGSGGQSKHLYFTVDDDVALAQSLSKYPGIDFKTSGFVVGPGSHHVSGGMYEAVMGDPDDITPAPQGLIDLLAKPSTKRVAMGGYSVDVDQSRIIDMLSYLDPSMTYPDWIAIGMAIHNATDGSDDGFDIWDQWSANGEQYKGSGDLYHHWKSFSNEREGTITIASMIEMAKKAGWREPVVFDTPETPTSATVIDDGEEDQKLEIEHNIETVTIDVKRPPGLVGEIAQWINQRCRFPRENLAVAAALGVVSNAGGMRFYDPFNRITANAFLFGVAASATGKEAILRSMQELYRVIGMSPAVHGSIKSEQEIFRNLIRHQAAIYLMDEMAESLGKIQTARKGGGASYLAGVIGTLLSVYSKSDGYLAITGDLKQDIKQSLQADMKSADDAMKKVGKLKISGGMSVKEASRIHPNDSDNLRQQKEAFARKYQAMEALKTIDQGIKNPFLSIFGLTTPERFEAMLDADMAANGFLGRSLIFRELEDNPRPRPLDQPVNKEVPPIVEAKLRQLYTGGIENGDIEPSGRVECQTDVLEPVETTEDAKQMLQDVQEIFWAIAENTKSDDSMSVPIPRRGFEQVAKVSFILALGDGQLRTAEHVRWAYALVKRDIDEKTEVVQSNQETSSQNTLEKRILSLVRTDHGETLSRIANKCRGSYKKDDVKAAIEGLVEKGQLVKHQGEKPKTGRPPAARYYACKS